MIDDHGAATHAVLRRDGDLGLTVVSPAALSSVAPHTLDALLDAADRDAAARGWVFRAHDWPSELPPLDSVTVTYVLEEQTPGVVSAAARGCSNTHGFGGNALRPEGLGSGIVRQRWVR